MKVKIVQAFDGYPDGKTPHSYRVGQVIEVPDAYGTLIIKKGHAIPAGTPALASPEPHPKPNAS